MRFIYCFSFAFKQHLSFLKTFVVNNNINKKVVIRKTWMHSSIDKVLASFFPMLCWE
jgi:hypothetical protein